MYYLFLLGKVLSLIFPREVCYQVARIIALIHFYSSKGDRETVIYNLSPLISDRRALRKTAKEVFINFAYYLVDFFRYSKLNKKFIEKYVEISGINYLNSLLSENKGIIALTAHIGNYELGGAVVSLLGYPFYAIALPHEDKRVNKFFDHQRIMVKINIIPTGAAIKQCFSLLRKGNIVAFLGDRDFFHGGRKVKILSRYASLPRGAAFFALKTGAYIVPSFLIRKNKKFYHLIFEEPISCQKQGLYKKEEDIIREYASLLERYIKEYPQQWYMFQKYWIE
jgi:KDO2-lipid IV(A) lauroyltransferase